MILGIYGAGGLGREVYEVAHTINCQSLLWSEIIWMDIIMEAQASCRPFYVQLNDFQ